MENASKALLIAGAILIAILLISVGIMVMNSADDVTGQAESSMQSTAIQTFNAQFSNYAGTQKGSAIKTLLNTVTSSNASSDYKVTVTATIDGASYDTVAGITAVVKSTSSYTVTISDSDSNGYYDTIEITG